MTFGTTLDPARNSLNAMRLALATLVIVSHAPLMSGFGRPVMIGDLELGGWAVAGFFAISGWLITASRLSLDLPAFIWRRALRIYPAFWVSLAVVAFAFAPAAAVLGGGRYEPSEALGFVVKNVSLVIVQPTIGGSLDGSPYQAHWNLSLWTLRWEFLCYLAVAALLSVAWARQRRWLLVVAWAVVSIPYAVTVAIDASPSTAIAQGSRLGGYFLAGAVAYAYRDKIPASARLAGVAAAVLALLAVGGQVGTFGAVPLAYLCLWLGAVLPLQRVGRTNDLSYGVYIYASPVQLILGIVGVSDAGMAVYTLAAIAAVLPLAWLSWTLVERPMLRLKRYVPARRLAGDAKGRSQCEPAVGAGANRIG